MESFAVLNPVYGGLNGAVISNNGSRSRTTSTCPERRRRRRHHRGDRELHAPSGIETSAAASTFPTEPPSIRTNAHVYGCGLGQRDGHRRPSAGAVDGDVKSTAGSTPCSRNGRRERVLLHRVRSGRDGPGVEGTDVLPRKAADVRLPQDPVLRRRRGRIKGYYSTRPGGHDGIDRSARTPATTSRAARHEYLRRWSGVPAGYTGWSCRSRVVHVRLGEQQCRSTVGTNLALVTNGSIDLANNSTWTGDGGTRDLFFMSPWNGIQQPLRRDDTRRHDQQQEQLHERRGIVYSVGRSSVANNNTFNGQIVGCNTTIQGNFTMNYRPVLIPGTDVVGFEQDVAYIREVS